MRRRYRLDRWMQSEKWNVYEIKNISTVKRLHWSYVSPSWASLNFCSDVTITSEAWAGFIYDRLKVTSYPLKTYTPISFDKGNYIITLWRPVPSFPLIKGNKIMYSEDQYPPPPTFPLIKEIISYPLKTSTPISFNKRNYIMFLWRPVVPFPLIKEITSYPLKTSTLFPLIKEIISYPLKTSTPISFDKGNNIISS